MLYNEWNVGDDNDKGNDNMMVERAMFRWRAKNQIYVFFFFLTLRTQREILYTGMINKKRLRSDDYKIFSENWKSLKNVRTRPGADCNNDHQLLTADIKFKLKQL